MFVCSPCYRRAFLCRCRFGVTWRAMQGVVVSRPSRMDTYSMLDDEDDAALLGLGGAAEGGDARQVELPAELLA